MTAADRPDSARRDAGEASDPLDVTLSLLDRQVLDREGAPIGKVDDIALRWDDRAPVITHLLIGPGAWAGRLPGLIGRIVHGAWLRLRPEEDPHALRIALQDVDRLDSAVHLRILREDLRLEGPEAWIRRHVIEKLPGAHHAP